MNNKTAKLLTEEERYPDGANSPTVHKEYACPCGQGKIIEECVPGFNDRFVKIECQSCFDKYVVVEGCGYLWELKEK
ncbi:MAG: hypothetical protein J1F65_04040 [Clostridiales bacterium]|nr:hypothetical protein [Clostridiales bacterium]